MDSFVEVNLLNQEYDLSRFWPQVSILWNAFHRTSYLVCPAFAIPLVGILEE
jgi:hypothetical protein